MSLQLLQKRKKEKSKITLQKKTRYQKVRKKVNKDLYQGSQ